MINNSEDTGNNPKSTLDKMSLVNVGSKFNPEPYWSIPIDTKNHIVNEYSSHLLELFDQNGYDLTELEKLYSLYNSGDYKNHRAHRFSIKKPWYVQIASKEFSGSDTSYDTSYDKTQSLTVDIIEGAVLNHCFLFERKGYNGEALNQLKLWAGKNPLFYKIIAIQPKYGIDFSMDYVDRSGNVFEIFHYEYDCFDYFEAVKIKEKVESVIENTDWNEAGKELLRRKDEWVNLPFFTQSDWKCKYFKLPNEKFKEICWNSSASVSL